MALFSGQKNKHELICGFVVKESPRPAIMRFKPDNKYVYRLRMSGKWFNIISFLVHAPRGVARKTVEYTSYGKINEFHGQAPQHNIRVLLCDLTAKSGKEEYFKTIAGSYSYQDQTHDNGAV